MFEWCNASSSVALCWVRVGRSWLWCFNTCGMVQLGSGLNWAKTNLVKLLHHAEPVLIANFLCKHWHGLGHCDTMYNLLCVHTHEWCTRQAGLVSHNSFIHHFVGDTMMLVNIFYWWLAERGMDVYIDRLVMEDYLVYIYAYMYIVYIFVIYMLFC